MRHPVPVSKSLMTVYRQSMIWRDALRESLEKQWKTEQEKKQQMSALAHDIKNTSYDCTGKCRTTFRD